jgi:tetratricopeptide (TPR) repeat protein/DNA-binding CsgD family transcriptional regulator
MMKRWKIVMVGCCFILKVLTGSAQEDQTASLLDSLNRPEHLPGLLRLAEYHLNTAPKLSILYASRADSLSMAAHQTEAQARALKILGDAEQYSAHFSSAKQTYERLLALYPSSGARMERSEVLKELGNVQGYLGKYELALQKYLQAYSLKAEIGDRLGQAKLSNNIGLLYYRLGNYEKARSYYQEALRASSNLDAPKIEASTLTNMGFLLSRQGKHVEALEYQQQASKIYEATDDRLRWSNSFINMGYEYEQMDDFSTAVQHYKLAIYHSDTLGHKAVYTDALNKLSSVYLKMGRDQLALAQLDKAYPLAQLLGDPALINEINLNYSIYYSNNGQYEQALNYYKNWSAIKDSLASQDNRNRIAELEILYQTQQKENEISLLAQKNARQRLIIIFVMITAFLLFLSGLLLWSRSRIRIVLLQKDQALQREAHKRKELEYENEKNRAERLQIAQQLKEEENRRLQNELVLKNSELSTFTMLIYQKNESLVQLQEEINKILRQGQPERKQLLQLKKNVQQNIRLDDEWDRFRQHFEQVHPGFFDYLNHNFPRLSQADRRHCAYIRMGLSTKEISSLLNIAPSSVQRARVRLKKKLELGRDSDLMTYIQSI